MNKQAPIRKNRALQIRLSTLLLLVVISALAAGWAVDRMKLAAQIVPTVPQTVLVFKLENASAKLVVAKLNELYANAETSVDFAVLIDDSSFIVNASNQKQLQIRTLMLHFDRIDTEYAKLEVADNAMPQSERSAFE